MSDRCPLGYLFPDFLACSDKDDVPVIVFVSKMVPVEKKLLPKNKQRYNTCTWTVCMCQDQSNH